MLPSATPKILVEVDVTIDDALTRVRQLERELGAPPYNMGARTRVLLITEHPRYGDLLYQSLISTEREPEALNRELPGTATAAAAHHDSEDSATQKQTLQFLPDCRDEPLLKELKTSHPGISLFY